MRSTAEAQRVRVIGSAIRVFAAGGFHATPVSAVASDAGVSPAYVFALFDGKLGLFVAAVDECFERVRDALERGADQAGDVTPAAVIDALSNAYVELVADRDLLMLQLQAQSACAVPEIRDAVRRGIGRVTTVVSERSGAEDREVQRFIAYGQLCHLIVTAELDHVEDPWASTLTDGMRHA